MIEHEAKWAEIDLDALAYNMKGIRAKAGADKRIAAVIKSNGYGCGAAEIGQVLLDNGADQFAVAVINEALELRRVYPDTDILVLGNMPYGTEKTSIEANLQHTVTSYEKAELLSVAAKELGKKARVHIKLDTGMTRLGFQMNSQGVDEVLKIAALPGLELEGCFTHFARADEADKKFADAQFEKYKWFTGELKKKGVTFAIRHVSNSAAIMEMPETYAENEMVRPGIILYGIYPSDEVDTEALDIRPVLSFRTRVTHIKRLPENRQISYGGKYTAAEGDIIGTIAVGYADGYTRAQSGKAQVIFRGKRVNVVGNICMDQCMIDLSEFPDAKVGEVVTLIGTEPGSAPVSAADDMVSRPVRTAIEAAASEEGKEKPEFISADEMALRYGTIGYEVVCAVNRRVPRYYIKDGKVVGTTDYLLEGFEK